MNADTIAFIEKRLIPETPSEEFTIAHGYYDTLDSAIETAYVMGKTSTVVSPTNVDVTYKAYHTHGDYCYPIATGERTTWATGGGNDHTYHVRYVCSVCGRSWEKDMFYEDYRMSHDKLNQLCFASYASHLVAGRCTAGGYQCGKDEGEYDTTDVTVLGEGDRVISATIAY